MSSASTPLHSLFFALLQAPSLHSFILTTLSLCVSLRCLRILPIHNLDKSRQLRLVTCPHLPFFFFFLSLFSLLLSRCFLVAPRPPPSSFLPAACKVLLSPLPSITDRWGTFPQNPPTAPHSPPPPRLLLAHQALLYPQPGPRSRWNPAPHGKRSSSTSAHTRTLLVLSPPGASTATAGTVAARVKMN